LLLTGSTREGRQVPRQRRIGHKTASNPPISGNLLAAIGMMEVTRAQKRISGLGD
jgi:hypothetical protein